MSADLLFQDRLAAIARVARRAHLNETAGDWRESYETILWYATGSAEGRNWGRAHYDDDGLAPGDDGLADEVEEPVEPARLTADRVNAVEALAEAATKVLDATRIYNAADKEYDRLSDESMEAMRTRSSAYAVLEEALAGLVKLVGQADG